jgi:N-formylmaleamate deformylase
LQLRAEVLASCDEAAVRESYQGLEEEDFFDYWARLRLPAVLVRGGHSPVVPLTAVADLRRARPDIEIVTVPGAGHMVPWDNLVGFLDAVRPYLLAHVQYPSPA